jgi:RNA polymerase sigma-70 factor, ECF subfamily
LSNSSVKPAKLRSFMLSEEALAPNHDGLLRYSAARADRVSDIQRVLVFPAGTPSRASRFVARKLDNVSEERSQRRTLLMARVQDGDRESCRALLDDIGPMLTNFLRRRIADRDEVEDVYQETLMAFFQARHTYDPSRPFEPWLFAIARNIAADHARRYWTRATFEQLTDTTPEHADSGNPSYESLEDAMARLPEQQRQAFTMLKLEGLTIEQAAQRTGTSAGTLRVRAHRAYKALRRLITE